MKQNDSIEELFSRLEGSLDLENPPAGHRERFRDRLEGKDSGRKQSPGSWWRHLSIAASIALLLSASIFLWQREPSLQDRVAEGAPEVGPGLAPWRELRDGFDAHDPRLLVRVVVL